MQTTDTTIVSSSDEMASLVDVSAAHRDSNLEAILNDLDRELVGLSSVKSYIRRLVSLLLVAQLREKVGLSTQHPTLHMSFTGHPGTGKTTTLLQVAEAILSRGNSIAVFIPLSEWSSQSDSLLASIARRHAFLGNGEDHLGGDCRRRDRAAMFE